MSVILLSDSSDEEIQFFPAEPSNPRKVYRDDDVIYCGERKATGAKGQGTGKTRYQLPPSVSKDVTVITKTVRSNIQPELNSISDDEVEIIGFRKGTDRDQPMTVGTVTRSPSVRSRSDSVNINISRNLTINIEDGSESNKKKVLLTFLGPTKRSNCEQTESNNLNTTVFKPVSNSTPTTSKPSGDNHVRRTGGVNSLPTQQRGRAQESAIPNYFPIMTTIHSPAFSMQVGQRERPRSSNQGNASVEKPVSVINRNTVPSKSNQIRTAPDNSKLEARKKPTTSPISSTPASNNNKTALASIRDSAEPIAKQKNLSTTKESEKDKLLKKPVEALEKISPKNAQPPVDLNRSSQSEKTDNVRSKDNSTSNKKGERSGKRDKSPVAGPSSALSDGSSSDESEKDSDEETAGKEEDEDSSDSSESSNHTTMSQPELNNLFHKFLDMCTKVSTKTPVLKMKVKLKKIYLNSEKSLVSNHDFISTLKEVIVRMDLKPVRCPLDLMKKVLTSLRKDSPSNERKIRRLEDGLNQINKKIKEFEEAEVTSDEDEFDNVYLKLDRYRKKAVQIYNKLCELSAVPADAERPTLRNVSFRAAVPDEFSKSKTIPDLVNRVSQALERYYNRSRKFPDFHDVKKLMCKLCAEDGVKLKPETLHQLAKTIFEEFGDMLQKRRLYDEYKICNEYLKEDEDDPYYYDPLLAAKLDANRKHRKTEKEVLVKYTLKEAAKKDKLTDEDSGHTSSSGNESDGKERSHKSKAKSENGNKSISNTRKRSRARSSGSSSGSEDNGEDNSRRDSQSRKKKMKNDRSNREEKQRKYGSSDESSESESKENREEDKNNKKNSDSAKNQDTPKVIKFCESNKLSKSVSEASTSRTDEFSGSSSSKMNTKPESPHKPSKKSSVVSLREDRNSKEESVLKEGGINAENTSVGSPSIMIVDDDPTIMESPIGENSTFDNNGDSVYCYGYQDAPTILISEKVTLTGEASSENVKKNSGVSPIRRANDKPVEDNNDLVILHEIKNSGVQSESNPVRRTDDEPMEDNDDVVILDVKSSEKRNSEINPVVIVLEEEDTPASKAQEESSLFYGSSEPSGIIITNVSSCLESFSEQNLTIDLLSDDEPVNEPYRPRIRNSLSQEEVDSIIPMLLGKPPDKTN